MSVYKPVPVSAAKTISTRYKKQAVVILAWDAEHKLTHTTTYGVDAFQKENAAAAGEICTKAIGMDLGKRQTFEDFHNNYDAARYKEAIELLRSVLQNIEHDEDYTRVLDFLRSVEAVKPIPAHSLESILKTKPKA